MNIDQPPAGVGIKLIESSDEELVIAIPPGGARCRFLGFFGLAWLGITVPVSVAFLLVPGNMWEGGQAPLKLFLLFFFLLFYVVGFGFLYAWLRMRFTKILIAVTADQFALQRTWFNSQKFETVALDQDSLAELVESYQENESPVYAIRMRSADELEKEPKFATRLSYAEKRWLAGAINNFLSNSYGHSLSVPSFHCTRCDAELPEGHGTISCVRCGAEHVIEGEISRAQNTAARNQQKSLEGPKGRSASIHERRRRLRRTRFPATL